MFLKTACDGCIFKTNYGCELDKDIFCDPRGIQFTEGLCGHKRTGEWIKSLINADKSFSDDKSFDYSNGENKTLSVIIYSEDEDVDKIEYSINSFSDSNNFIKEIIYVGKESSAKTLNSVVSLLQNRGKWKLDNILDEDFDKFQSVHFASRLVDSCWFLPIESGTLLKNETVNSIFRVLNDYRENPVAFYFNPDDDFQVASSVVGFQALQGHSESPWFSKVKTFSNWEGTCKKMI